MHTEIANPTWIVALAPALLLPLALAIGIRIRRPRRPRPHGWVRAWSLIGLTVTAPALARERRPVIAHRAERLTHTPPWSDPDGSIPPQPSGRTGDESRSPTRTTVPPAGRRPLPGASGTYLVRPGDCLWTIASEWLRTDDPARIARYWPRIHRANRSVIGADPNLIHPGQVLMMPPEGAALASRS